MLKSLLSKWITPVLSQTWLLVAGAFGVLVIVVKTMAVKTTKLKVENKTLKEEVKKAERILDVKTTTTRDAALDRLHSRGSVRDD